VFTALCFERTIVVFNEDEIVVNHILLSLHCLLRPLRWVCGSLSFLPLHLWDLLNAPNPLLIGMTREPESIQLGALYVDTMEDSILWEGDRPNNSPRIAKIETLAAKLWKLVKSPESPELLHLLRGCNEFVAEMLAPVAQSIMTDFSDPSQIQSKFFVELYLKQFAMADRAFVREVAATQMFMLYVEQSCRRKSEAMGIPDADVTETGSLLASEQS
jgi:hypothetical protein